MTLLFGVFVALYSLSRSEIKNQKADQRGILEAQLKGASAKSSQPNDPLIDGKQVTATVKESFSEPMSLSAYPAGWAIRMKSLALFAPGRSEILESSQDWLESFGKTVIATGRKVRIAGFAAPSELGEGKRYASAWELSAARAASVMEFWRKRHQVNPMRFEIVSRGAVPPDAIANEELGTDWARQVEILILRDPI
jgi:chemotaxis protein MotB